MCGGVGKLLPLIAAVAAPELLGAAEAGAIPTAESIAAGITGGENAAGALAAGAGGGGALMPAAVPEADPTFGGALREVSPGVFASPESAAETTSFSPSKGTPIPGSSTGGVPNLLRQVPGMPGSGPGGASGGSLAAGPPAPTPPTAPVGGGSGVASGGSGGFVDNIWNYVKKNPGVALAGGSLLASRMASPDLSKVGGLGDLQGIADQLKGVGSSLVGSEASGNLPPGQYAATQMSLNDSIGAIKSKYASMGLSGSTAEQQDITAANERAAALRASLAERATQVGLQALGGAGGIFQNLAQVNLASDKSLSDALARFAAAAAGGAAMSRPEEKRVP